MKGPFNLGYLIKGAGREDWYKALGLGTRFFLILVIVGLLVSGGMSVWRIFFPKPSQNISKSISINLPGSTNTIDQSTTQQIINPKRKWWEPIPYVSVYGEVRGSYRDNSLHAEPGVGIQAGVRWDF